MFETILYGIGYLLLLVLAWILFNSNKTEHSLLTVTDLFIHPIKSCAPIRVQHARLDRLGLEFDRRWMFVDITNLSLDQDDAKNHEGNNNFHNNKTDNNDNNNAPVAEMLSQRMFPKMAFIQPHFGKSVQASKPDHIPYIRLTAPEMDDFEYQVNQNIGVAPLFDNTNDANNNDDNMNNTQFNNYDDQDEIITVKVWKSEFKARVVTGQVGWSVSEGLDAGEWLAQYLGTNKKLALVELLPLGSHTRAINKEKDSSNGQLSTGFADGYPFLIASLQSLEHINQQIRRSPSSHALNPVPMVNFRPNIVVDNDAKVNDPRYDLVEPFDEDGWKQITIGNDKDAASFDVVKPCTRCVMPTIQDGCHRSDKQPTKWLRENNAIYKNEPCFGQNLIHHVNSVGKVIYVGDQVVVTSRKRCDLIRVLQRFRFRFQRLFT